MQFIGFQIAKWMGHGFVPLIEHAQVCDETLQQTQHGRWIYNKPFKTRTRKYDVAPLALSLTQHNQGVSRFYFILPWSFLVSCFLFEVAEVILIRDDTWSKSHEEECNHVATLFASESKYARVWGWGWGAWTYCRFLQTWVWSLNVCTVGGTLNLHICHLQCTFFAGVSIRLLLPACTIFLSALLFLFFLFLS